MLQEVSKEVWKDNYKAPKEKKLSDTWERQAKAAASIEDPSIKQKIYEDFLWLLTDFHGIAGGRVTANLGVEGREGTTLMNCFVHNPADIDYKDVDSIRGIYDMLKAQALTLKSEGGYGMNFSWIRPAGMYVSGIGARTPGVLAFMELWEVSSKTITRGSEKIIDYIRDGEKKKIRKGAQMGILEIWHPEIEDFIEAKLTKGRLEKFNLSVGVTNGFMDAVINDETWELLFPDTQNPKYETEWNGNIDDWKSKKLPVTVYHKVKARYLWDKIMHSTYTRNEPGVIFLDLMNKLNPLSYGEHIATTNPCLTGETIVAVADGKGDKTIKELADAGLDVPVYCLDNNDNVTIRTMRHPRWTGKKQVYKITLEEGCILRQTENHKYKTTTGEYKKVKDLKVGDGLKTMSIFEASIKDVFPKSNSNSQDYRWINYRTKINFSEHRLIYEFNTNRKIDKGMVIHHKDYNARNNTFENLMMMSREDHNTLHSKNMIGDLNPMNKWYKNASAEEKQQYHDNMSESISAEKNGRFSGYTNDELKIHALKLTESIGRIFSLSEWETYAKSKNLPLSFSKWRKKHLNGISGLAKWAAKELNLLPDENASNKILQTYKEALDQGYDAQIKDNEVIIHKKCEYCDNDFTIGYKRREQGVCSALCGQMLMHRNRKESVREKQLDTFNRLKFELKREPNKKEWTGACKNNDVSPEISRESSPFRTWNDLKEAASTVNHRIVSIEKDGFEDVYNGTVDEFHNFFVGGFNVKSELNKRKSLYFNNLQCGEIGMSTGVCNLMSLNLVKFIIKGNDGKYYFDYDKFKKAVSIAVRFSDNINDISKVPLDEYKKSMTEKRRIGIGTLGIGSLHYILGIKFGSEESLRLIEGIYCAKAEVEILSSAKLGKEKGSFAKFNREKYFNTHWWKNLPINKDIKKEIEEIGEMRNSHHSANAPTGNMSVYVGCVSSGVEPVFLHDYVRWVIVHDHDKAKLREKGFKFPDVFKQEWFETEYLKFIKINNEEILQGSFDDINYRVDKNRGLIRENLVEDYGWRFAKQNFSPEYFKELNDNGIFVTTDELSVDDHVNTLKIIARYTNMSTSKTINIPADYTFESFKHIYMKAWESGIKGVTSYRAGTMAAVLEKKQDITDKLESLEQTFIDAGNKVIMDKVKLPDNYYSMGYIIRDNNNKKWYVNIAFADKSLMRPFALFVSTNNKESHEVTDDTINSIFKLAHEKGISKESIDIQIEKYHGQSNVTKIARTIGFVLHHNIPVIDVVNNLVSCDFPFSSFSFHITRLLKKFIKDGTKVSGNAGICPECKSHSMIFQDGCIMCKDCNWSKCG